MVKAEEVADKLDELSLFDFRGKWRSLLYTLYQNNRSFFTNNVTM